MKKIISRVSRFFREDNVFGARKRYLFVVPFIFMGAYTFILTNLGNPSPDLISFTIAQASFIGVVTLIAPWIFGSMGVKNLYVCAVILIITRMVQVYVASHRTIPAVFYWVNGTASSLLYLVSIWVILRLSKRNTSNQKHQSVPSKLAKSTMAYANVAEASLINKSFRAVLILLQVGGGFIGINIILYGMLPGHDPIATAYSNMYFFVVFCFGIISAILLAYKPEFGFPMSFIYQVLQIFTIRSSNVLYSCAPGFITTLLWSDGHFGAIFSRGSFIKFVIGHEVLKIGEHHIGINILPLIVSALLLVVLIEKPIQRSVARICSVRKNHR